MKNNVPYSNRPTLGDPTVAGLVLGTKSIAGDINLEWMYQGCELLLAYCLGAPTIVADTPVVGAYTWRFEPATGLYAGKGLSLEANYEDWAHDYYGCKVNSIAFNMAKDQNLQATCNIGGREWAKETVKSVNSSLTK